MAESKDLGSMDRLTEIEKEIKAAIEQWCSLNEDTHCLPLLITPSSITNDLVDDVFDDLVAHHADCEGKLDVIVDSSGGDIDSAYNLALLFRRYGSERLRFIVPRWAKSAATLLVCAGDCILMTPVAELGPLDPQITEMNPLEGRLEQFSPLHIGAAMQLIRDEYDKGNEKVADKLIERLQFPLTLGKYRSTVDIGKEYLRKLLSTRMLKDSDGKVAGTIADKLTTGYSDHGYCIGIQEAQAIGLIVEELSEEHLKVTWSIHRLTRERMELKNAEKRRQMQEKLKEIPPELLEQILKGGEQDEES